MALCTICQTISLSKMRGRDCDQIQPHQPSYLALKISAEAGCRLCQFFWIALCVGNGNESDAALSHVSERYPGRELSLAAWGGFAGSLDRIHIVTTGQIPEVEDCDEDDCETTVFDLTMHPDHQVALDGVLELFTYSDDPAASHGGINGRPLPTTAGDTELDFMVVEDWLQICSSDHQNCREPNLNTPLPTRIIDVGSSNNSDLHLLETSGQLGAYIALSHCWGEKVPIITTMDNIAERQRSIPLCTLPKTFKEAVLVTQRLGIRYLWIDSLCIIQDSKSDWQKEAGSMEAVYQNCYLNISARAALNSEAGCFISRLPEPEPCQLPWTCYQCIECSLSGWMYIRSPEVKVEAVRDTACDRRGWILQEQLLSPRVLYYGSKQMYWECCESTLRQDGRFDDNALYQFGNFPKFKRALGIGHYTPLVHKEFNDPADGMQYRWCEIVEEFTRRQLKFQSDKLAAISGLAKAFQKQTEKTYLAGMWQEDLPFTLRWYRRLDGPSTISNNHPSWSWAKIRGRIGFGLAPIKRVIQKDCCKLIDVIMQRTSSLNSFDNFLRVTLHLQGHLIKVLYVESQTQSSLERNVTILSLDRNPLGSLIEDVCPSRLTNQDVYCVLLYGADYAEALALASEMDDRDVYRRVGLVNLSYKTHTYFLQCKPSMFYLI